MLRVGDLERSLAFYRDVLGMQLLSRKDYPEGKFTLAFVGYGGNPERGSGHRGDSRSASRCLLRLPVPGSPFPREASRQPWGSRLLRRRTRLKSEDYACSLLES